MVDTDDLRPTWTPRGVDPDRQAESMRELRVHALEGRPGRHALGELLLALAYGRRSLSEVDMARVSLLTVAEVQAINKERLQHHLYCNRVAAEDRVARRSVSGLVP
jgi:hypothetical protein